MFGKRKGIFREKVLSWVMVVSLALGGIHYSGFTSFATSETPEATETTEATEEGGGGDTQGTDNGTADASVNKAREDAKEAQSKKRQAQEILDSLKNAKENIELYIIELDKSLNELQIEISHLEQNQKKLEESIAESEKNLKIAKGAQENQYEEMKKRIQMVYESGDKQYLDILLTASSMTDVMNKTEYAAQVSLYDYNILQKLKTAKEQVANLKMKLDRDLETNEKLQAEVNEQRETMETLVAEKSRQLGEYEQSIASQQQEVAKYAAAQAEAEAIIIAAESQASSSANSVYTGGIFNWPVPGYNRITSYFGGREAPLAGASSNHKGIDIACDTGAPVVAASSGTVIVATYNYAEGNYICIDHGGGVVTLYMHNSSLLVSVGETVAAGQQIAAAGSTGYSTGPHCHFGVRVDGVYVDPLGYLQ